MRKKYYPASDPNVFTGSAAKVASPTHHVIPALSEGGMTVKDLEIVRAEDTKIEFSLNR